MEGRRDPRGQCRRIPGRLRHAGADRLGGAPGDKADDGFGPGQGSFDLHPGAHHGGIIEDAAHCGGGELVAEESRIELVSAHRNSVLPRYALTAWLTVHTVRLGYLFPSWGAR